MKYNYINLEKLSQKEKCLLARLDDEAEVKFSFLKKDGTGEEQETLRIFRLRNGQRILLKMSVNGSTITTSIEMTGVQLAMAN